MINKGNRVTYIGIVGTKIESINEWLYRDMQMQVFSDIIGINQ